jgi:pectinesterase
MADTPIYRVPVNDIKWGERIYHYNCHRDGSTDYKWYADNLPAGIKANDININWLFKNKWNPLMN